MLDLKTRKTPFRYFFQKNDVIKFKNYLQQEQNIENV